MTFTTRDGITFEVHAVCKEDGVADVAVKQDKPVCKEDGVADVAVKQDKPAEVQMEVSE